MGPARALRHERRLWRLALGYAPLVAGGAWLSVRYRVGAHAGGDPARDLALRGTGLAPPLFLPVALLGATAVSGRPGAAGAVGTAAAGCVGLAFLAGSTLNLANDVAAARGADAPVALTVGFAAFHWVFGPALVVSAWQGLRRRRADGKGWTWHS
jgi:hypothetical protein